MDKGTTLLSSFRLVDFQDDETDLPKLNERFGFRDSLPHMEIPTRSFSMLLCRRYREQSRDKRLWLNEPERQTLIEIVKAESTIMHFRWTLLHFLHEHTMQTLIPYNRFISIILCKLNRQQTKTQSEVVGKSQTL